MPAVAKALPASLLLLNNILRINQSPAAFLRRGGSRDLTFFSQ
jgi:hypothetical protein